MALYTIVSCTGNIPSEMIGELIKSTGDYLNGGWIPVGGITSIVDATGKITLCQSLFLSDEAHNELVEKTNEDVLRKARPFHVRRFSQWQKWTEAKKLIDAGATKEDVAQQYEIKVSTLNKWMATLKGIRGILRDDRVLSGAWNEYLFRQKQDALRREIESKPFEFNEMELKFIEEQQTKWREGQDAKIGK